MSWSPPLCEILNTPLRALVLQRPVDWKAGYLHPRLRRPIDQPAVRDRFCFVDCHRRAHSMSCGHKLVRIVSALLLSDEFTLGMLTVDLVT